MSTLDLDIITNRDYVTILYNIVFLNLILIGLKFINSSFKSLTLGPNFRPQNHSFPIKSSLLGLYMYLSKNLTQPNDVYNYNYLKL